MNTHALILAAGKGSRFGFAKAWIEHNEQSLLQSHLDILLPLMEVSVVVSSQNDIPPQQLFRVVENNDGTDMMSSIRKGVTSLSAHTEVLIVPVDTIPQKMETITTLLQKKAPAVLAHQGKPGHPILLTVESILSLAENQTLKDIVSTAQQCESDISCIYNINRPQDWEEIFGRPAKRWNNNNHPKIR